MQDLQHIDTPPAALRGDLPPAVSMGDLTMLRSLGMARIPSLVIVTEPDDITRRSRHAHGHCLVDGFDADSKKRTADRLIALGRRLKPFINGKMPLFYGTDSQLAFVHEFREPLSESYLFLLNSNELARALWDKELFYDLARRAELPVPRTARGDDLEEISSLRGPLLVKPKAKVDWKHMQRDLFLGGKARVFGGFDALVGNSHFARERASLLVQEHIPGGVRDLYSFHGFVGQRGDLLAHYAGRKIRTFPSQAGESSFIELVNDPQVTDLGERVIRRLGVRGVFKIDMIKDERDGTLYVLEINARYNLWNYLGAVHGVNLPVIAYEYLAFGQVPACGTLGRPRYRWLNFYRDYKAYREQSAAGSTSFARWATSIATSRNVYEAFAWNDPEPFGWWVLDSLRKKLS